MRSGRNRRRGLQGIGLVVAITLATGCDWRGARNGSPRALAASDVSTPSRPADGPLRASGANPRYFATPRGDIVYLTGSHTWNNLQDWGATDPPPAFDYSAYLDFLVAHGHNFIRFFNWEQNGWMPWTSERLWFAPLPYQRTGPGLALDGAPKFDLTRWNEAYFSRVRSRVEEARRRGIYVSMMLFNGFSVSPKRGTMPPEVERLGTGNPWRGHPFNGANNINGVDADVNRDGDGTEAHTLADAAVTTLQKAYVTRLIEVLMDLDNVLWEISNESNPGSQAWQYEMARFINTTEAARSKVHPVGITVEFPRGDNQMPLASPAAWVALNAGAGGQYRYDPPDARGRKVVFADTDHLWGIGGSEAWVWKSFMRGFNPVFMDPYKARLVAGFPIYRDMTTDSSAQDDASSAEWEPIRRSLGFARMFARRVRLDLLVPHPELASTGYCLADPGREYLVYVPPLEGRRARVKGLFGLLPRTVSIDLTPHRGEFSAEWFDPTAATTIAVEPVAGGGVRTLTSPFSAGGVLYLVAQRSAPLQP